MDECSLTTKASPTLSFKYVLVKLPTTRVEATITDHLRDFAPNMEKYKMVQFFPTWEDRIHDDHNFFGNFIL